MKPTPGSPSSSARDSMNVLLIGSDDRDGTNAQYGDANSGARSDTTMLLHVAADRKSATVASIPRDSMVQTPACVESNGTLSQPQFGMFNAAFSIGGAACTVKTVETFSGLTIDHVLVVDFTGFKKIVDAIGGVPVHLDQAVNDPDSHLFLPAGTTVRERRAGAGLRPGPPQPRRRLGHRPDEPAAAVPERRAGHPGGQRDPGRPGEALQGAGRRHEGPDDRRGAGLAARAGGLRLGPEAGAAPADHVSDRAVAVVPAGSEPGAAGTAWRRSCSRRCGRTRRCRRTCWRWGRSRASRRRRDGGGVRASYRNHHLVAPPSPVDFRATAEVTSIR